MRRSFSNAVFANSSAIRIMVSAATPVLILTDLGEYSSDKKRFAIKEKEGVAFLPSGKVYSPCSA